MEMDPGRIVVIDDEPITRLDVREMLQQEGYQVLAEGGNGEEAIRLAHQWRPDLIVMDIKMPLMDGLKAARILRQSTSCAVLLLTAFSQSELVEQATEAGVFSYLVKPVMEESFLPAVRIALHQHRLQLSLQQEVADAKRKLEERKLIDKAKGRLMEREPCTEQEAYGRLRKQSMTQGIAMAEVAKRLLAEDNPC
jgi:response regulator NasT